MNIASLIDFCKQNFPERTIDLCEAIDLMVDTLTNLKSDLGKSMPILIDNDDYDSIDECKNHAKSVAQIIQNLNNITIDDTDENEQILEIKDSNGADINYNDKIFNFSIVFTKYCIITWLIKQWVIYAAAQIFLKS